MSANQAAGFGSAWSALLGRWRRRHEPYVYGRVFRPEDGHAVEPVRLEKLTGRVQFILWRAGEQGHKEDFWQYMGYGWEKYFLPTPN